jgi:hypothetical protein
MPSSQALLLVSLFFIDEVLGVVDECPPILQSWHVAGLDRVSPCGERGIYTPATASC